ncbi:hypothetical protein [Parazoarcus communis]|uniref:hypothetical protein n=1 Tax=Parazoarcus communis TaxID=41977 RepID=UPI002006DD8B|nr:hypothetical protein [Parazoarcus communis]
MTPRVVAVLLALTGDSATCGAAIDALGALLSPASSNIVDVRGYRLTGLAHLRRELARGQIPGELASLLDIVEGALVADAGKPEEGGLVIQHVEEAVRGEVHNALR